MKDESDKDRGKVLEGDVGRDVLTVEVQRELVEALIRQRKISYDLKRLVEKNRRFRIAVESATRHRDMCRAAFAAITWTDDIEEAHNIAARALREVFEVHDDPPSGEGTEPP